MRDRERGDRVLEREVEPAARTIAVTRHADLGDTLLLESREHLAHAGLAVVDPIAPEPGRYVELDGPRESVLRRRVLEQVRRNDPEAVACEVVAEELCVTAPALSTGVEEDGKRGTCLVVHEVEAENVGEEDHYRSFVVVTLGCGDIAVNTADLLGLACMYSSACTSQLQGTSTRTLGGTLVLEA